MGQGGVGKTAMVLRWTNGEFNEEYMPTIGDMYTKDLEVGGQPKHIEIDDTAGQVSVVLRARFLAFYHAIMHTLH